MTELRDKIAEILEDRDLGFIEQIEYGRKELRHITTDETNEIADAILNAIPDGLELISVEEIHKVLDYRVVELRGKYLGRYQDVAEAQLKRDSLAVAKKDELLEQLSETVKEQGKAIKAANRITNAANEVLKVAKERIQELEAEDLRVIGERDEGYDRELKLLDRIETLEAWREKVTSEEWLRNKIWGTHYVHHGTAELIASGVSKAMKEAE